ncbi:MAG: glycosyltransferase family 4 protein [Aestuariivirgaceae bacterium]
MRVAFYSPLVPVDHPTPSGDRQMARQLLRILAMGGHDAAVVSDLRSWSREASEQQLAALATRAAGERARITDLWENGGPPDLWLTYHPYYKSPDLLGPALSARAGIPYVTAGASISIRRQEGEWQAYQAIVARGLGEAARNLYFAPRDRPGLLTVVPAERLVAFPPFIDIDPAPRQATGEPPTIVSVGMARPGRKLENFRIMAAVLARIVDLPWRLVVLGGGACQADAEAAFSDFPEGRVSFRGERPRAEVFAAMASADLYLWPGFEEAYGLSYLEAAAHGLPVVAWDTAGVPSVVCHGRTGLLAPSRDEAALAGDVARLLGDPALRRQLGEAGRAFALGERSMANAAARLADLLAGIVQARVP